MMKKFVNYMIAVTIVLTTACDKDNDNVLKRMTMTTEKSDEVVLYMAGSGNMTIDWGDGTIIETHTLLASNSNWNLMSNGFIHAYSGTSFRTITITGENITHLSCYHNELTSLDVSKNIALTRLECSHNQLTSLDVSNNTMMKELYCHGNQLTNLDVNKNTMLTTLFCSNRLTSLDVSKNTKLSTLMCDWNLLTELDVSNNTELTALGCNSNQLNSLDVSKNIALVSLDIHRNQLTSLDVSSNVALSELRLQSNDLTYEALNILLGTLHNNTISGVDKKVYIFNNPGTNSFTNGTVINGFSIITTPW